MHTFHCERREFQDRKTGRTVWQVTNGDFECSATYMDKPCWTADETYMLIASNFSGAWQPYRLSLETGEAVQVYETPSPSFLTVMAPETNEAFIPDGQRMVAVNLETLEARVAVDFSASGREAFKVQPVIGYDGSVTMARHHEGAATEFWFTPTDGRNEFEVLRVDPMPCQPGHDNFIPGYPKYVCVNAMRSDPHGPLAYDWNSDDPDRRVKTWRIERETGAIQPLIPLPQGISATHVVWTRDGERLHFHRKTQPTWVPTALCSVDREGGDFRVHYETSEHRLGHSCPHPHAPWIVTDSQDKNENILMLVHLERDETHMLCWPDTSIHSGRPDARREDLPAHPHRHTHPGFSHSGRFVHYTSDVGGTCQVYVVPVADLAGGGQR